ncbi:MAG: NUDIX domain-containing protein [Chlamydiota bacterium]
MKRRSSYALSVDCIIFGYTQSKLQVALIQRRKPPYKRKWAIPGGFVEGEETVEEAAFRELQEETGLRDLYLQQFHVFSQPDRDPRGRVITVAFFALIDADQFKLVASEDASRAVWWATDDLPHLSFDHDIIYEEALKALRIAIKNQPLAFELLPKNFTLTQLQLLYEEVFDLKIDKRNFRKKVAKMNFIQETGKLTKGAKHRPAMLYTFNQKKYAKYSLEIMF